MRHIQPTLVACLTTLMAFCCASLRAEEFEARVAAIFNAKCGRCHGAKAAEAELDLSTPASVRRGGESGGLLNANRWEEGLLWTRIDSKEMPPEDAVPLTADEREAIRDWLQKGAKFRATAEAPPNEDDITPIFLLRCIACHGGRRKEADLDLRTRDSILKGGQSGPAILLGEPDSSLLVQRVAKEEMPPRRQLVKASVKPMRVEELERIKAWIAAGAPASKAEDAPRPNPRESDHWAFQTPRMPSTPAVENASLVWTPIDAFLLSRLESKGLRFAPEAPPHVWFRRVALDLTGLPPTPKALERFLADESLDARSRAVDRLLASPKFGERWAQIWLDVAGYADSEGAQNEDRIRTDIFRYRDYVIRAFNSDKPYRRFLLEQIAGDELADYRNPDKVTDEIFDNIVATGFLRTAPDRTFADITNFVPDRLEVIADEIQVLSSAVLGLTMQCARCHSHKFDPISQRDYYRLSAALKDGLDEHDWLKPESRKLEIMPVSKRRALEEHNRPIDEKINELRESKSGLSPKDAEAIDKQIAELEKTKQKPWRLRALWSRGTPSPTYLLRRGDYLRPAMRVEPGAPAILESVTQAYQPEHSPDHPATGQRLALARWLTQDEHPLTARVWGNRLWAALFGRGLVQSLGNFGVAGEPPSHPELLDYLAVSLTKRGWSSKQMLRELVLSRAYAQSTQIRDVDRRKDPDGLLLSRMPLRRMNAEMIRDALLLVAGRLRAEPFGPPDPVDVSPQGLSVSQAKHDSWRRTIYVIHRRTQMPTLLENFDAPQMSPNCLQRQESIVATQALHLMNNGMVQSLAVAFAERIQAEAGKTDHNLQVRRAFLWAFGRHPHRDELEVSVDYLEQLEAAWKENDAAGSPQTEEGSRGKALTTFCHSLLNSASFIYIE